MKKEGKYELIKKLSLKPSPLTEKVQDNITKLAYVRKKIDISGISQQKKDVLLTIFAEISKMEHIFLIPSVSYLIEGEYFVTVRRYESNNLREFLIHKFNNLSEKMQRKFIKDLFISLVEFIFVFHDKLSSDSLLSINIKPENILIDSQQKVYFVDVIRFDEKQYNYVFLAALITLFIIRKGYDTQESLAQITLSQCKELTPKSIFPLLFMCLGSPSVDIKDIYKRTQALKKYWELKESSTVKENNNNELFIMRRAVIDQAKEMNIVDERLKDNKEMLEEAANYFLSIEKGVFQKTIDENWLVVKNRMLESDLKKSLKIQQSIKEEKERRIEELSGILKTTQENAIHSIMTLGADKHGDSEDNNNELRKAWRLSGHFARVNSLSFFENEIDFQPKLISVSSDQSLIQWDLLKLSADVVIPNAHNAVINKVLVNRRSNVVYTGANDNSVKVWDLKGEIKYKSTIYGAKGAIQEIKAIATSNQLVFSGADPRIFLYNENKEKMSGVLKGHDASVWSIKPLFDDTMIASVSSDRTVKLWDLETRKELQSLTGHQRDILTVESLMDEKLIVTGGLDQSLRFWDPIAGDCVELIYEGMKTIRAVIRLNQQGLFACLSDHALTVYDARKMKKITGIQEEETTIGLDFFGRVGLIAYGLGRTIRLCKESFEDLF